MKTILLVEDEAQVADMIKSFLGVEYLVIVHTTGEAAIQAAGHITPDLIILDLFLAGSSLTGLETLSILHSTPGLSRTPILAMSGRAGEDDISHARALGAADFLAKPYNPGQLLARIEKLLRK